MASNTIAVPGEGMLETVPQRRSAATLLAPLVVLTVLGALGTLALLAFAPPPAKSAAASPTEFSAARALTHVAQIAQRPHPTGTADNARVRRYLVSAATAAGADVEVESGEVLRKDQGSPFPAATVHNVIARVPGSAPETSGGKALLLVAHYDSVPTGPGAADDGAAVASMLETIRALRASGGVRDDVTFLFTDGEEVGLLGATMFVRQHGIDGYGAVLNWEARGNGGPVLMFETGEGNSALIDAFAGAGSRPIANSLAYEVYRRMPNGSDFTVFRQAGANGLNAAFISGLNNYHTTLDNPGQLSADSVQHHGDEMLGMIRGLGNSDLRAIRGGDAVYFDLFSRMLVRYPTAWAVSLAELCLLLLFGLLVIGRRRAALTVGGLLTVAGCCFGVVLGAGGLCLAGWQMIIMLRPELVTLTLSEPYDNTGFVAGFAIVTAGLLLLATRLLRGRSTAELLGGVLLALGLLLGVTVFTVPGASYLLQWPVTAGLPALWLAVRGKHAAAGVPWLVLRALPAAAAVVLYVPLTAALVTALGTALAGVAMAMAAVCGVLLMPVLRELPRPGLLSGAALCVAVAVLGLSVANTEFGPARPTHDSVSYVRDLTEGKTVWVSGDPRPDSWTTKVLGAHLASTSTTPYFPEFGDQPMLTAPAPPVELAPPTVELLQDTVGGGTRTVRFRAVSHRQAWKMQIRLPVKALRACTVAGSRLDTAAMATGAKDAAGVVFQYFGASGGVEMTCELDSPSRLPVEVADFSPGHTPEVAALVGPRPDGTTLGAYGFTPEESTVVRQTVTL